MNRNDEPHIAAIAARSPHSCGPNASRLVPWAVSISGRLLLMSAFFLPLLPPRGGLLLVRTLRARSLPNAPRGPHRETSFCTTASRTSVVVAAFGSSRVGRRS